MSQSGVLGDRHPNHGFVCPVSARDGKRYEIGLGPARHDFSRKSSRVLNSSSCSPGAGGILPSRQVSWIMENKADKGVSIRRQSSEGRHDSSARDLRLVAGI